jgi:hypothetical protein
MSRHWCDTCGRVEVYTQGDVCSTECGDYYVLGQEPDTWFVVAPSAPPQRVVTGEAAVKSLNRAVIFRRDQFRCAYCGQTSYEDNIKLSVDHIVPRQRGGGDAVSNLITSCMGCNTSKSAIVLPNIPQLLAEVARRNKAAGIDEARIVSFVGGIDA